MPSRQRRRRASARQRTGAESGRGGRTSSGGTVTRWARRLALAGGVGGILGLVAIGGLVYSYAGDLPSLDRFGAENLPQSMRIYAHDGNALRLLEERAWEGQRRVVVPLDNIAPSLRQATIAIEDRDFYSHRGINPVRIVSAFFYDVVHRRAAQGASTITQQVIKSALLQDSNRSLERKFREFILAIEVENRYDKDRILETYLNNNFYGNGSYGIETAARTYFGKPAKDLSTAEASFLAGLPQRPSGYDPFRPEGFKRARARQRAVLDAMVRERYLAAREADAAYAHDLASPLKKAADAYQARRVSLAPHFVDYVIGQLEKQYDATFLYRGGLTVVTTLDARAQEQAVTAVARGIDTYKRQGANNGALLAIDAHTGAILAMVGSANYADDGIAGQVNITTSGRAPGSSFKAYTYLTALSSGYTPATILEDSHGRFGTYEVHDWDGKELGWISLRESLAKSRNISSVRLFQAVGMDNVFNTARALGLSTKFQLGLSATLGDQDVRMVEHVAAYATFANGGLRVRPFAIEEVRAGPRILAKADLRRDTGERVIPPGAAYLLTDILKDAVNGEWKLGFPVAGKSGTTTDFKDSWYVGYTPEAAVGAWMGRTLNNPPRNESMPGVWGEFGGGMVWREFLKAYVANHPVAADWSRPGAVRSVLICKALGLRADHAVDGLTRTEFFVAGTEPTAFCPGMEPAPSHTPTPSVSRSPSPTPGESASPSPSTTPRASPSLSPSPTPTN